MKKVVIVIILVIAVFAGYLVYKNHATQEIIEERPKTPGEVVKKMVQYLNDGEYEKAKTLIDMDISFQEKKNDENYFQTTMDELTKNRKVKWIEIVGTPVIEGNNCTLRYELKYMEDIVKRFTTDRLNIMLGGR